MSQWSARRREVLEAKIREYEAMPAAERELRLEATELRFFLRPLLEVAPADRPARVAIIPDHIRPLVAQRLSTWDALPEPVRSDFLAFDRAAARPSAAPPSAVAPGPGDLDAEKQLARWQALPAAQREKTCREFELFFELSPRQRERILGEFTEEERQLMQQALDAFGRMPPEQRRLCLASFRKLAELSSRERAEFLSTVDRWRELPPAERQRWRQLVTNLPPAPPGLGDPPTPPLPPLPAAASHLATNSGR
jgi:hypothetical protein